MQAHLQGETSLALVQVASQVAAVGAEARQLQAADYSWPSAGVAPCGRAGGGASPPAWGRLEQGAHLVAVAAAGRRRLAVAMAVAASLCPWAAAALPPWVAAARVSCRGVAGWPFR
jgi:hypothetical protein